MKFRNGMIVIGAALAGLAHGQLVEGDLYGIGFNATTGVDTLYKLDKGTGAATAVFSFNRPTGGGVNGMTFNPITQKFVSIRTNTSFTYSMVEIDAAAMTATVVATGMPTSTYEGIEYVESVGGLVVSYASSSGNPTTTNLALLNNSYGLVSTRTTTGMADMDNLFVDENGFLNSMDTNNLTSGSQRWRFGSNLFTGVFSKTSVGNNVFSSTRPDSDLAYDAVTGQMFLSMETGLGIVNSASTSITSLGNYGLDGSGNAIRIRGLAVVTPVPEPATLSVLAFAGIAGVIRRRRSKK